MPERRLRCKSVFLNGEMAMAFKVLEERAMVTGFNFAYYEATALQGVWATTVLLTDGINIPEFSH